MALAAVELLGLKISAQVMFNGTVVGLVYGILAVGLIIVYRSSGVINFAHAQIGIVGAALLAKMVIDWNWPFAAALLVVIPLGGLVGMVVELTVIRRLFHSPRVIVFVATLGVVQVLTLVTIQIPRVQGFATYPTPVDRTWHVAGIDVRAEQLLALVVVLVSGAALAWFFGRTIWGVAVRGGAANPDATRLAGISVKGLSTIVWTIAGLLATVTVVVSAPLRSTPAAGIAQSVGTGLLLRALAIALIARMRSLPVALAAGAAFGLAEAVIFFNYTASPGLADLVLLFIVLAGVLVARPVDALSRSEGAWAISASGKPIPERFRGSGLATRLPWVVGGLALAAAIILPLVVDQPSKHFLYTRMVLFAVVALSVSVLTGWAGQLSLGQLAFAGLGAFSVAALDSADLQFAPAVLIATGITVGGAMIVGLPALRVRGLYLAITTLAFAAAADGWLFEQSIFLGDLTRARVEPEHLLLGPLDLRTKRTFYYVALALLVVVMFLALRVRRSGIGRSFIAVRDNEACAAAYTISPVRSKLMAFGIGGGLAGIAGAAYGGLLAQFNASPFGAEPSIQIVAIAVIGGLGSVAGPVLGALWVIGLPALFGNNQNVALLTSGAGLLILLMYFPGGFVQIAYSARDALFRLADSRSPALETAARDRSAVPVQPAVASSSIAEDRLPLVVEGLSVSFGGRLAVHDVDLDVHTGEIVGLIGANGAGKTTLMNAVGGFVPSTGEIELLGQKVGHKSPARRARLGLGRAFQNADLFGDLTVLETIALAFENKRRTSLWRVLSGAPGWRSTDRSQRAEAGELADYMGLGRYVDHKVSDLSTGTRRITELASLLALGPRLLCLDEPTAGVAQRETEAFGPLLVRIRAELGAAMLVIEHDMPLIMSISDRVYCLEAGKVIAEGLPEEVRTDPLVIASYLGTDERAIRRSGTIG